MSVVYFTSDWHLGHFNVAKWREKEDGIEINHHDDMLFDNYISIVKDRDVIWFLGDIIMSKDYKGQQYYLDRLHSMPGRKRLVLGNHDTDSLSGYMNVNRLSYVFEQIHGMYKFKRSWLSHAPIHPMELRGRANIHGHMHRKVVPDSRYINVSVEQTDYKPVPWQGGLQPQCQEVWENSKEFRRD